ANSTIVISKDATGAYVAQQLSGFDADAEGRDPSDQIPASIDQKDIVTTRVYRATLSFGAQGLVNDSLQTITEHLYSKGYRVKIILLGRATDALLELILPYNTSCNQAEKELLGYIENHGFPTRAAIKERGGEKTVFTEERLSFWEDINPATSEWYISKSIVPPNTGFGPVKIQANGSDSIVADIVKAVGEPSLGNGEAINGMVNGSAGLLGSDLVQPEPQAPVSYGKTRSINRKASTISLAA
ncbi:hypothetical protein K466DRAFT_569773, partial [Polyporus arcularius HHB13444]